MAELTPNTKLPYIDLAQAQKHVTHNEAIRALDAIVQLAVLDRDLTEPPRNPADGSRYIVAAHATGAWAGHDGHVMAYQDGAWFVYAPREGGVPGSSAKMRWSCGTGRLGLWPAAVACRSTRRRCSAST